MEKIIDDRKKLRGIISKAQQEGKKVVFANGCFDILHVGHIRYLKGAKQLGDILVVGVNTDESIMELKGKDRPVISLAERLEILGVIEQIDYLIPFGEKRADKILMELKPDVHAKGTDYSEETVPERDTVMSYGGRVAIVGDPKDHSVTEIITKMKRD